MDGFSQDYPRTAGVLRQGMEDGLHVGAQLYVSVDGKSVIDVGMGEARPGVAMTPDTVMLWLSCSKPVGAVALARLWEAGKLDLDDRVTRFIPEFGANGKDAITLRHLLTHTGGFRAFVSGWPEASWEESIARICAASLEPRWLPGRKAGYHVDSSWFILGEVVRRLSDRPYEQFVREEIFEPLGMFDSWIAMPLERYRAYGSRLGLMRITEGGTPRADDPFHWNDEAGCTRAKPGGSGHGPIRELGRFYEMLLRRGEGEGVRILSPQTVEALTARHRTGMLDHTFQHVMDWGLGFIINSAIYGEATVPYGFGPYASPRTFGHGGYQSSASYCDPERGLVVAAVFNGAPGEAKHHERIRAFNRTIYEDLEFTD